MVGDSSVTQDSGKRPKVVNAERDSHRFFRRLGLAVDIPIQTDVIEVGSVAYDMYHVKVGDWLKYLIRRAPCVLAGGDEPLQVQLESFWSAYRWAHPTHAVFDRPERLKQTLPILLFGDEGKGPKRGNYMLYTFETPIGLSRMENFTCSCHSDLRKFPQEYIPDCYGEPHPASDPALRATAKATHNYKGHVYLKRYLLFGILDVVYKQDAATGYDVQHRFVGLLGSRHSPDPFRIIRNLKSQIPGCP